MSVLNEFGLDQELTTAKKLDFFCRGCVKLCVIDGDLIYMEVY